MGEIFLVAIILFMIVMVLGVRQYNEHQRIKEMQEILERILEGNSKEQIFVKKKDFLGNLGFSINRLARLYIEEQDKYEKEQFTKKQLVANLSHDVRTPLVSVIGYLEAIVEKRVSKEQEGEYIQTAYDKASDLKEKINLLFEFVQSDANEILLTMKKIDVCEITRQVLIDFLPVIEKEQIVLESLIPDEELYIEVDQESFSRIVQNIIRNTLIHGKEGKYLGVFIREDEGAVHLDIVDKGEGIRPEHLPFVFERLYKAEGARTRGGGLGLAIAKELANKMNGNVQVLRSIPGDTVFRVTFPGAK